MAADPVEDAIVRRLPDASAVRAQRLAAAYREGAMSHAVDRTCGVGPVSTSLGSERADLLAHVSRAFGQLLSEDEVSALLRIPATTARALRVSMLAVYDDLPKFALATAFEEAKRDGRGSSGDLTDGYRVKFKTPERLDIAESEISREGYVCEVIGGVSQTSKRLLIESRFPIDDYLAGDK